MLTKSLNRSRLFLWTRHLKPLLRKDLNYLGRGQSNKKIDVIIPCLDKDHATLPVVVDSIRKFLNHPVGKIFIVAPKSSPQIEQFCRKERCVFVDEKTVAPLAIDNIKYHPLGQDRTGWIYQQLIKLSGDKLTGRDCFMVWDADTALTKSQAFFYHRKYVLNHSDEYHAPYFTIYQKLVGEEAQSPVSFISHQMIISKKVLGVLKSRIEEHTGKSWWEGILDCLDPDQPSSFSEYELYGNFLYSHYPKDLTIEYWFNKTLPRSSLMPLEEACRIFSKDFKSVSWHSYNS